MWIVIFGGRFFLFLAGLRVVLSRLGGVIRRRKVKVQVMEWWHKMVFPVRRAWFSVSTRVRNRRNGAGLLKLHNDIQSCGYEDVQIMWEMLRRTESQVMSGHDKHKSRWLWKNFSWSSTHSNHGAAVSFSSNQTS